MALLTKKYTSNFDSISIGDKLPVMQRHETNDDIANYLKINERRKREKMNPHVDKGFSNKGFFGGLVNYGVCTCAYMVDLLELAFPTKNIVRGTFVMRAMEPIRAGDIIAYSGKVLDKRSEHNTHLVDVEVTGTNASGQIVAVGKATIPF